MDVTIQERVVQKENELNATYDERMRNYEARYATVFLLLELLSKSCQGTGLASSSVVLEGPTSRFTHVKRIDGSTTP